MSGHEIVVRHVPMIDTGIGQSLGYESDAALIEEARSERAKLPRNLREAVEKAEADLVMRSLFGTALDDLHARTEEQR